IDWSSPQAGPPRLQWVAYGNNIFVAVGNDSVSGLAWVSTSTDGKNWPGFLLSTTNHLQGIAYGNGRFVAVGAPPVTPGTATNAMVMTSTDGTNWVAPSPLPFTGGTYSVRFVKDKFYTDQMVYSNFVDVYTSFTSTDGAT